MGEYLVATLAIVTMAVIVLAFIAVIRRLLGVRVGFVRTAIAAGVALAAVGPLMRAYLPDPDASDGAASFTVFLLSMATASLLAMVALVIAEVIVPEGSLPGPWEVWRGWRARVARARRYTQIVSIALRHGLGRFMRGRSYVGVATVGARRDLARSVREALDEGGVTFVKLGQQLSTRRDLIPPEFVDELSKLQDSAAPVAWSEAEAVLTGELGRTLDHVFAEIDRQPLAAASVAQVHSARLRDGGDVVVKVQRPGVAGTVERDLDILDRLAATLESRTAWGRALGVGGLADGFGDALREELDFRTELDNMRTIRRTLPSGPAETVRVPTPYPDLCTERILVMERLEGVSLGSATEILESLGPERRREMATALLSTVFEQVLVYGVFHVDIHPGNVLVHPAGSLGLLDLGSVGRIDRTTREALGRLLDAIDRSDSYAATHALLDLVSRTDDLSERDLERDVGALIVRHVEPGYSTGAALFTALFQLVTSYRLAIPAQVAAVFRTFATLDGTLTLIDPGFDLLAGARDVGRGHAAAARRPDRLRRSMEDELAGLLPVLRRLPHRLDRIADSVEQGRLAVRLRLFADPRDRRTATALLHQTLLTILGAAAGLMGVTLLGNQSGPAVTDAIGLYEMFGYALLIVSVVLVLRVLVVIFRHDPGP